jgi:hypothetical protein
MDGRRVDAGPDAVDVVGVEVAPAARAVGTVAGGGHGAAATLGRGAATTTAAGSVGVTVVLDGGRDDGGAAAPLGVACGMLGGFGRRRGVVQRSQTSWRWREK